MVAKTKNFGEINIADEKIITFNNGIIGFPELKQFALVYNDEKGEKSTIKWLQSMNKPDFALPVLDPLLVCEDYNPQVDDEILRPIGDLVPDSTLVLTTVTVPQDMQQLSVNLKAPIVINAETRQAIQVIVDGDEYPVKFYIYAILQMKKAMAKAKEMGGEQ